MLSKQNPIQNILSTLLNVTVGVTLKNVWGKICKTIGTSTPLRGKNKSTHIILPRKGKWATGGYLTEKYKL